MPSVDAGADRNICIGTSTVLGGSPTGPAGSTYLWDNATTLDDNTLANPTATPAVTTTYTVTVSDLNGCTNTASVVITVDPIPDVDAGADQTICNLQNVVIGGSPTSTVVNAAYLWDNAATLDDNTLANPTASPNVTTTYTVTVTHPNGCTNTDQIVVNVNPLPNVDAGADLAICIGGSSVIGGSPTSSTAGVSYLWDNASTLDDNTLANPTANPVVTTTYTVTVTDLNGCTNTDQILVTVNPLPIADAGTDQNLCNGLSLQLGGAPTGPPGSIYLWDNAASLNDNTLANPTANPTVTTTYTVTVTDVNGCTNTDQVVITVIPIPDADAGPDQTICNLQAIPIGGSPTTSIAGASILWDNAASLNDNTLANPVASPNVTTTYTVTVTHPNGCTNTDQMTVTVNPLPGIDAGADRDICIGNSTVLGGTPTSATATNYLWDNAATLDDNTIANPTATPTVTTTYSLTVTDANGCVNTDQVVITVNPLPIADAGIDQTICDRDTISIGSTANLLYTYLWDNASTLDDNTLSDPRAFPSVTTTYTVTVTETATSCTNTDQVTITVIPIPFADAGSDDTLCVGSSTTIGGNPTGPVGTSFAWDNAGSLSDPSASNPVAAPFATTTYTVTVTNTSTGCTNTDAVTIVVNPNPIVDAGADVDICEGDTIQIGGSPTGPVGALYSWDNGTFLDDATISNPLAFPTDTTTFIVTVTDTNGCVSTDQIIVNVLPAPNVDAGVDQTICLTDSAMLGGSPTGPAGATFVWTPSTGLSDATVANPMASPSDTTMYIVTITDGAGCSSIDTVMVFVNPLPSVDFMVDQTCVSDFAAFTDLSSISVGSIASWSWDFGDGVGTSNLQNPAYQYSAAGNYDVKLEVTSVLGCIDSLTKEVQILPLPVADAGLDIEICVGDTIQIGSNPTGLGNVTYSWSPGADLSNVNDANPMAYPLSSTSYNLSVIDQEGCVNYDTVEVDVNPLPIIDAGIDTTVCSFSSLQLSASGATNYQWTPNLYLDNPNVFNPISIPEKSIDYVVYGTDLNGCIGTDTVKVDVMNVDFSTSDTSLCFGDSVQLQPIVEGDISGITYHWSPSIAVSNTTILDPFVFPPVSQQYQLTIRNAKGCVDVDSILVKVEKNANVSFEYVNSVRCSGTVLEISNTSTNTDNFLWKLNGDAVSDEYNPKIGIDNNDTNRVTLIGWNQLCSDSTEQVVEPATIDEILQFKGTNVFTPNNDGINDLFDPGFEGEFIGCANFRIYDRWGEKVFDSNIGQYGWDGRTLRGKQAPQGIYYYIIMVAGKEVKGSVYLSR